MTLAPIHSARLGQESLKVLNLRFLLQENNTRDFAIQVLNVAEHGLSATPPDVDSFEPVVHCFDVRAELALTSSYRAHSKHCTAFLLYKYVQALYHHIAYVLYKHVQALYLHGVLTI